MKWLRQWTVRDVLKLLAVELPVLLCIGVGLGWLVHEYHRHTYEMTVSRATTAALSFYEKINEGKISHEGKLLRDPKQREQKSQQLKDRLSAFAARRDGPPPLFPSATAAFLWISEQKILWSTNLVGERACLATANWTPSKSSLKRKSLGKESNVGWQSLRELGVDSAELIIWAKDKRLRCVCGLLVGPPEDEGLPLWTVYVVAAAIFVIVGLLFFAGGVSLVATIVRARGEMERRNTFVSNAAHEVKTPLASILMRAERLADGSYATEERRAKAASVILEQGRELRRRIERLRDFDRVERGMRTYERREFDLGEAVRETARPLANRFEEHGLDLVDVASVHVVGDRNSVMEIVENLLANAAKYAAHAGVVSVCVARAVDGHAAEVCVADCGPGLPAAQMRHVFDRDWRAPNELTKSVGGWGVGLAFARDLARDMGGDLTVAASPGGGCAFTLVLPLVEDSKEEKDT